MRADDETGWVEVGRFRGHVEPASPRAPSREPEAPAGPGGWWRRQAAAPLVHKFARYASVSAISTVVSLSILGLLVATRSTTAGWANVLATGVATIPSFELNRRWVWAKSGRRSIWAEVGPFVAWCFAELGLSTLAVSSAVRWADQTQLGTGARTSVALTANVATFGSLWLAQFLILDRILFRNRGSAGARRLVAGTGSPGRR